MIGPNGKILIVDDEPEINLMLKDAFKLEGYEVYTASNGVEGIIQTKRYNPDIIIMDIMMPDLNGYDVIKILREEIDTPIILLSAKQSEVDKVYGFGIGADDYVVKPFSIQELKARVAAHIRRERHMSIKGSEKELVSLKFGKLAICIVEYKVYYDSHEIVFTNKEFEITKLLALHPGQTFTRENIYELVWEDIAYYDSHTITEHIKKIRRKLQNVQCEDYIQTVWGVGYKWSG
ncbi:response regulator transcription factor [Bacillus sp. NPDC057893]|uniref:response regulator transcription factor n=1 Tax=Bacillus sp. NPDC057893 TaxID=3346273 RepID=UPI00366B85CB